MFKSRVFFISIIALLLLLDGRVAAQTDAIERTREVDQQNNQRNQQLESETEANSEVRIDENQRRICEVRQTAVNRRADRIKTVLSKQLKLLNTVFDRLDKFITAKAVDMEDYDQLKNEVAGAKDAATATIVKVSDSPPELQCEQDDHTSDVSGYRKFTQDATAALKSYHQSLRHLMQEVKAAADTNRGVGPQL